MKMKAIMIIWIGGGLGSVFRYLAQLGMSKLITITFPGGTFLVNITGCFIIGLLYGLPIYTRRLLQNGGYFL
jgi:CrcB protein